MLLTGTNGYTQTPPKNSVEQLVNSLDQSRPDSSRIDILWHLGDHYLYLPGNAKEDIDSAFLYLNQAVKLSDQLQLPEWKNKVFISLATCYIEAGRLETGKTFFKQIIAYYKKQGNSYQQAHTWLALGDQLANNGKNDHQQERKDCYQKAAILYKEAGDKKKYIQAMARRTHILLDERKTDEAEKSLLNIRDESKRNGYYNDLYGWALDNLTTLAASKGDFYQQLFYQFENLDALKKHKEYYTINGEILCYNRITDLYLQLDEYDKAEIYAKKELSLTIQAKGDYIYPLDNLINALLNQGKTAGALTILKRTIISMPPDTRQSIDVNQFFGRVYAAMRKKNIAERYFLRAVRGYRSMDPKYENIDYFTATYETIAEFYVTTGQFHKAAPFLSGLESISKHFTKVQKSTLALNKSKVDSASGNYFSALKHFQYHSHLKDTLFNIEKASQLNHLEVSFETKQKQNQIRLLDAQNKTNLARAQKADLARNITAVGILVMLVISGITFNTIRNKIKSNRLLTAKNNEIDRQNSDLQLIVSEKEGLLREKEVLLADKDILLREVHHRVKNNLQIVMSLLSTQLEYLENKEALQAIEESQQRVQAIALIHSKLYKEKRGLSIDMNSYIMDMVEDLTNIFSAATRRIRFKTEIDIINLDVDFAVPVGLILNEAITNAIKYAFDEKGGEVRISLTKSGDEQSFLLKISDNGKGFPKDFDLDSVNSLGIVMMKGLSGQIRAEFKIINDEGVTIWLKIPVGPQNHSFVKSNSYITTEDQNIILNYG
ncbi:tetratricopeptide repeat-containing sensor histidine kinase [Mucilaginibacter psychrotolerans]|nr:histidine kinase dimerization/phosphoacceptor domain -containing protein [Mucilaginibacter psychrotolerans]